MTIGMTKANFLQLTLNSFVTIDARKRETALEAGLPAIMNGFEPSFVDMVNLFDLFT